MSSSPQAQPAGTRTRARHALATASITALLCACSSSPPPGGAPDAATDDAPVTMDLPIAMDVPVATDLPVAMDVSVAVDVPVDTGPTCTGTQQRCGAACVEVMSDPAHCGGCGAACPTGQLCAAGRCALECAAPRTVCGAMGEMRCVDLNTDATSCGACGTACATGLTCVAGTCTLVCPAGRTDCAGLCVDAQTDLGNCGACGTACASGRVCRAGACNLECPTGQTACGDACVTAATDDANCGACGNACPSGQVCAAGACACPTGQTLCGSACVTTGSDARNCGACGRACSTTQNCVSGSCSTAPPSNDLPAGAIPIQMAGTASTITGTTVGAVNNAGCQTGGDVYYRFTLTRREVVYADTFGTTFDTTLAFAPSTGMGTIAGTCTDDTTDCGSPTLRQERLVRVLDAGTYYVVVGSFDASSGPFTLHFQHQPVGRAHTQITAFTGAQTVMGTTSGESTISSCGIGAGPENTHWFVTCPNFVATELNMNTCGGATWDTVLQFHTAGSSGFSCNDNGCGGQSLRTTLVPAGAGLHTIQIDGRTRVSQGAYSLFLRWGACPAGTDACGATCRGFTTDPLNCGSCGSSCFFGGACEASTCRMRLQPQPGTFRLRANTTGAICMGVSRTDTLARYENCGVGVLDQRWTATASPGNPGQVQLSIGAPSGANCLIVEPMASRAARGSCADPSSHWSSIAGTSNEFMRITNPRSPGLCLTRNLTGGLAGVVSMGSCTTGTTWSMQAF